MRVAIHVYQPQRYCREEPFESQALNSRSRVSTTANVCGRIRGSTQEKSLSTTEEFEIQSRIEQSIEQESHLVYNFRDNDNRNEYHYD